MKGEGDLFTDGGNKSGLTTPSFRFRPLLMLSQLVSGGLRFLARWLMETEKESSRAVFGCNPEMPVVSTQS